jgi:hypothetical protein
MSLGRLALATETGWSGNLDYMTNEDPLLIKHLMVPVEDGQFPFGERHAWAEPDVDYAVALVEAMLDDRTGERVIAARGRSDIRLEHSFRAVGLRILDRVTEISATLQIRPAAAVKRSKTITESSTRRQTSPVMT